MSHLPQGLFWSHQQNNYKTGALGRDLSNTKKEMRRNESERDRQEENLQDRLNRLELINMTLWSFLKEKFDLKESDFVDRMVDIDLMDGQLDGKLSMVRTCTSCKRKSKGQRIQCMYCGNPVGGPLDGTGFASFGTENE